MTTEPAAPIEATRTATDLLIVASWFPAVDDLSAGRFVADQAEALAATGRVRVAVATFDGVRLSGGITARGRQEEVVDHAIRTGIAAAEPLLVTPAIGVRAGIPVARLAIPEGQTAATGVVHAAIHRGTVLRTLGERLVAAGGRAGHGAGIVHAHTAYPDGAAAIDLADLLDWPLVVTEHSSFVGRLVADAQIRQRYVAVLTRATRLFAVSEVLAIELRSAFPEYAAKIEVVPNAVPLEQFAGRPLAERERDELLFVGYRKASKGIEILLRAFAAARAERPSLSLRLVGGSPDAATEVGWQELARTLDVADAVIFDAAQDRAGVADAMGRASLFVHPSPRETFGVVAVEALASGTPVVATDSGGVSEILGPNHEHLGAIVPVNDPAALGAAILATLDRREGFDPALLRSSVERFRGERVAERILDAIDRARGNDQPGATQGGPSVWASVAGTPSPVQRKRIVVALDRRRAAQRLATLPVGLQATLIVVTAIEPRETAMPHVARLVEVRLDVTSPAQVSSSTTSRSRGGAVARLARLVRDPLGTVARRLGRGTGSAGSVALATKAIEALVDAERGDVDLVPLDGIDHVAVLPAISGHGQVRLVAGGLRDLADRWSAAAVVDGAG